MQRLARVLIEREAACAIAVRDVPRVQTRRYGIVSIDGDGAAGRITAIVEKPDPADAPSTLAVNARYDMTPAISDAVLKTPPDAHGEVGLSQATGRLVDAGDLVLALRLPRGVIRHDIGSHESCAAAFLHFALTDPDRGESLRALTRTLLLDGAARPR